MESVLFLRGALGQSRTDRVDEGSNLTERFCVVKFVLYLFRVPQTARNTYYLVKNFRPLLVLCRYQLYLAFAAKT